jgi:hypothetical protein
MLSGSSRSPFLPAPSADSSRGFWIEVGWRAAQAVMDRDLRRQSKPQAMVLAGTAQWPRQLFWDVQLTRGFSQRAGQ